MGLLGRPVGFFSLFVCFYFFFKACVFMLVVKKALLQR